MRQLIFITILSFIVPTINAQLKYPISKKVTQIDTYFKHTVSDPYRWLEDDNSEETKAWVINQNKVTKYYFDKIAFKDKFYKRIEEVYNFPKYSAPFQKNDWLYWSYNDGLKNQSSLYRKNIKTNVEELVLDPNLLSKDGTAGVKRFEINKAGTLAGIAINESGSDWQTITVFDLNKKEFLKDEIKWVKFSGITWKDDGYYYSRYPKVDAKESKLSAENKYNKVYYHKLGTTQEDDILIYDEPDQPNRSFSVEISDDEKYLFLSISNRSSGMLGNALYMKDLSIPNGVFKPIKDSISKYNYWLIDVVDSSVLLFTNHQAPNNKVISLPLNDLTTPFYKHIIPEKETVLINVQSSGNRLFAQYLVDVSTICNIHDYKGKKLGKIDYPSFGTASMVNESKTNNLLYYSFNSFGIPPTIYSYNLSTGKSEVYKKSEFKGDLDIVTERIFYTSKDGTKVPLFIVHKKNIKLNGANPTILYGYGGFNVVRNPSFNPMLIPFLEAGGIYALANIRGGGEYGEKWHLAGTKLNKQNVFDDFIAAAEYLQANKYTSPKYLAIQGGSNGGLLVGAVVNQRPELFRVAIPQVGVMDMLRFHKFTIGKSWISDYGSSEESEEQFKYLYHYSPLHNIKTGLKYPSILVNTADHDDRVVPAHSFKYVATLQEMYNGKNPMLIRIDTKSGHGASNTKKMLELTADIYSYIFYEMGLVPKF